MAAWQRGELAAAKQGTITLVLAQALFFTLIHPTHPRPTAGLNAPPLTPPPEQAPAVTVKPMASP